MQRILYLIQKEFRQVFRDRAMLVIMVFAPIVQTILLGFAMTTDVKNIKLVIYDADHSTTSRELSRRFIHSPSFRFIGYAGSPAAMHRALDNWQAQIGIFIEPNFARHLQRNLTPSVQIVVDGLDGNSAGIALGYARAILADFSQEITTVAPPAAPVVSATRMWYNLDLNSKNYMVPGIIAVLLTVVTMFLSSMALVREKEIGTLEQLMVTPIRSTELVVGKLLPFLLIGLVAINITLAVAFVVFDLTMAGSYLLLLGVTLLYFLTTLGLGMFISTLVETQQQALFVSWFFMVFLLLMSGFFTPIANMPVFWQKVTLLNPMRYFMILVREIFLKGTSVEFLRNEIIPLAVFGLAIISASAMKFQKRVH